MNLKKLIILSLFVVSVQASEESKIVEQKTFRSLRSFYADFPNCLVFGLRPLNGPNDTEEDNSELRQYINKIRLTRKLIECKDSVDPKSK